jgi:hypothetical protein
VTNEEAQSPSGRSKTTGLLVALVVAIVAAAGISAIVISGHGTTTTSTSTTTNVAASLTLPIASMAGGATHDSVLERGISGSDSRALPSFTPTSPTVYFQFVCVGDGSLDIAGYFTFESCNATRGVSSAVYHHQPRTPVHSRVIAPSSVHWEIYISGPPTSNS